jgi:type IV secretion system protein VirB10
MPESLKLGDPASTQCIRRLNRLPIIVAIVLVVLFFGVIIDGLSSRGLRFGDDNTGLTPGSRAASTYADQLKEGVPNGIIGEPVQTQIQPAPVETEATATNPFPPEVQPTPLAEPAQRQLEPDEIWRARLDWEQEEQILRELHRQRMASLQADDAAYDSRLPSTCRTLRRETLAMRRNLETPARQRPAHQVRSICTLQRCRQALQGRTPIQMVRQARSATSTRIFGSSATFPIKSFRRCPPTSSNGVR